MKTHDGAPLGGWVRRFLVEHLVVERNLSRNTQRSYRDTLRLLIPFAADHHKTAVDRLIVTEVSADVVRDFLRHVEEAPRLWRQDAQSAISRDPCARDVRRRALPRADSLVRRGPCGAVQTL
jgi:site-specific recombinase XerD